MREVLPDRFSLVFPAFPFSDPRVVHKLARNYPPSQRVDQKFEVSKSMTPTGSGACPFFFFFFFFSGFSYPPILEITVPPPSLENVLNTGIPFESLLMFSRFFQSSFSIKNLSHTNPLDTLFQKKGHVFRVTPLYSGYP